MLYEIVDETIASPTMTRCGTHEPQLPVEIALQCLTWLPGPHAHFIISTSCRTFKGVAKEDDLWCGRLTRDFPRCRVRGKARGTLYVTYKILARAHKRHFQAQCTGQPGVQAQSELWWQLMASRPSNMLTLDSAVDANVTGAHGIVCDGCDLALTGKQRYKCAICPDYDLCANCHARRHELHARHADVWTFIEGNGPHSNSVPRPSSAIILTPEEVEQHVRQLRSSRREEPNQVAAAFGAQGGGVERVVAIIEGSRAAADLPASTFESVGTGIRRLDSELQDRALSNSNNSLGVSTRQVAQLDEPAHAGEEATGSEVEGSI
jgi:hypothetical protein